MTIDTFNYNTRCRGLLRTSSGSKKMEEEEKEGLRTVECLRGRLLAEREVSRSTKQEAELITKKLEELEKHLKEEIRLREKAEKRLKYLMKKLESIKGSSSSEGSEQLSSSEASCLSSASTSASKEEEEEKETHENGFVEEDKIDHTTENVTSMEKEIKDRSSGESSVVASTSSQEGESQAGSEILNWSDTV